MDDDEEGTIPQRIAHLQAKEVTIRDLLMKVRPALLKKPNDETLQMQMATLQDLLKSTRARVEWLKSKGHRPDR